MAISGCPAARLMSCDPFCLRQGLGRPAGIVAPDEAVTTVVSRARPGDLVLTIGAGDVTVLAPRILAGLEAR